MMDELEVVRRLGAAETTPDPKARERVRARVVAPSRRRARWPFALVPAGAVALGAAFVVMLGGPGEEQRFTSAPTVTAPTPPKLPSAPELFPRPDQYLYVRARTQYQACRIADGVEDCRMGPERIREVWMSERRTSRLRTTPGAGTPSALGHATLMIGNHRFSHAELARYRPTPRALLDMLIRERPRGQGGTSRSYPFTQITDALREVPMPAEARRALVGALTLVPGVTEAGDATDREGRVGVRLTRRAPGGAREEVIVDPLDLTMLEERTYDPGGALVGRATYLERAVTVDTKRP